MIERVVTFLDTDIEGSTRALRILGPRYPSELEVHRRLLRRVASEFGGKTVDAVGDSVLLSFDDADTALQAAMVGQLALPALWDDGEVSFRVRMGMHTGPVWIRSHQYYGLTIHKVARISHLAEGGQILLSSETASLLKASAPIRPYGTHDLDDFGPEELYEVRVVPMELTAAGDSPR